MLYSLAGRWLEKLYNSPQNGTDVLERKRSGQLGGQISCEGHVSLPTPGSWVARFSTSRVVSD